MAPVSILTGLAMSPALVSRFPAYRIGAAFRSVELERDQSTVPGQDSVWLGDTGHFCQLGTTEPFANLRQRGPLWIREAYARGKVRAQNPILGQIFALKQQTLIQSTVQGFCGQRRV